MKMKLVVLSGAGISAESGISTFRDAGGLWEGHDVMEVATFEGWQKNQELVLDFYNQRRKNALESQPNKGHQIIADLEEFFEVTIITQNVDNLHEKAGSSHVIHLHGELAKAESTSDASLVYDIDGWELNLGDTCDKGAQLRPHIVWFGEAVPKMDEAIKYAHDADIFVVVGTSLQVYPAAGLIDYVPHTVPKYVVDPNMPYIQPQPNLNLIEAIGSVGMQRVYEELMEKHVPK